MRSPRPELWLMSALGLAGCAHFTTDYDGQSSGPSEHGGGPARAATAQPVADTCEALALIDDAEDGDDQVLVRDGRAGYIYTFVDQHGTRVSPGQGDFKPAAGGAHGSTGALRFHGTTGQGEDVYAGVGVDFAQPRSPYDASKYTGISFLAKKAAGSGASHIRLAVPDVNTDPKGGVCKDCFNNFGIDVPLTEEWTRFVVEFADIKQMQGWGDPRPEKVDVAKVFGLQFQVASPGQDFDVWLDDIQFTGCP